MSRYVQIGPGVCLSITCCFHTIAHVSLPTSLCKIAVTRIFLHAITLRTNYCVRSHSGATTGAVLQNFQFVRVRGWCHGASQSVVSQRCAMTSSACETNADGLQMQLMKYRRAAGLVCFETSQPRHWLPCNGIAYYVYA